MIRRYAHPDIEALWSQHSIYEQWKSIAVSVFCAQIDHGVIPRDLTATLRRAIPEWSMRGNHDYRDIEDIERRTKHDVAAFLEWMRGEVDKLDENGGRWVGYGLTSSDLVDTAMGMRFRDASFPLTESTHALLAVLGALALDDTPILARTHGQVAELMTMRARARHWLTLFAWPGRDNQAATRRMKMAKLSGPVGTFAHNPPLVEAQVSVDLGLQPLGAGASQVIPRSALAAWASSAAGVCEALAKIATDVRLMNMLGEAVVPFTDGQVGSSAMAHKRNPIVAEQICGLARMARGYALMLAPVDTWLERDIAHSSVERVAVPDLWHILLRALDQTTLMLQTLTLDRWKIQSHIPQGPDPLVVELTLEGIQNGLTWEEARAWATSRKVSAVPETADHFMRNYPVKGSHESA